MKNMLLNILIQNARMFKNVIVLRNKSSKLSNNERKKKEFSMNGNKAPDDVIIDDNFDTAQCYDPIAIANYFIDCNNNEKQSNIPDLTIMKLIKLVYVAHGWALHYFSRPLINEAVEAWPYGPVVPSVYYAFRMRDNENPKKRNITKKEPFLNLITGEDEMPDSIEDKEIKEFLDAVWQGYKDFDAFKLSDMTHNQQGAWFAVTKGKARGHWPRNLHISNDMIKKEFDKIAAS